MSWTLGLSSIELNIEKTEQIYLKFVWSEDAGIGSIVPIGAATVATLKGDARLVPVNKKQAMIELPATKLSK